MWIKIIYLLFRGILSIRYRIRVRGLENLNSKTLTKKGGILFLPNHPAEIDPVILTLILWSQYRPQARRCCHWCTLLLLVDQLRGGKCAHVKCERLYIGELCLLERRCNHWFHSIDLRLADAHGVHSLDCNVYARPVEPHPPRLPWRPDEHRSIPAPTRRNTACFQCPRDLRECRLPAQRARRWVGALRREDGVCRVQRSLPRRGLQPPMGEGPQRRPDLTQRAPFGR